MFKRASNSRQWLIAIILVSLLLRIGTALWLGDSAEPISGAFDQYSYDALAQRVLAGKGFSFPTNWYPFTLPDEPTAHWSYVYTLYLAGVYALAGHHPLVARLIQVGISGLHIWIIFRIGRRLFGEATGLVAAALTAIYAYFIFFNATLMTQTFYILAVLAVVDLTLDVIENPTRRGWIWLGIAIGIGAVIRQTLLIFSPVLLVWILWNIRRRIEWRAVLISIAIIAAFILPWTIYNYFTFHDFLLLNSNGGYWFFSSNHPGQGTNFNPNFAAPLPAELRGLTEPAIDRALYRQGIDFIFAEPGRFALLTLSRVQDYFWISPSENSTLLSNWGRVLSFTFYLPFMLIGLALSARAWRACAPLYLYIAFDTILSLTTWAAPRYRLPSDALLIVFAGLTVVSLVARLALPRLDPLKNGK
ncbi:MAG: glycosyltransferase family 39 protein [Chloroflexi bacterium]|nr:glycosyltransferase family 39 protein [Chloroflexota bacterium]